MKFFIIPREFIHEIECDNAQEAMEIFATTMDLDMNIYFKAVSEEQYRIVNLQKEMEAVKNNIVGFMSSEFESQYGLEMDEAEEAAEEAYNLYVQGNGQTQYECIQDTYEAWVSRKEGK